MELEVGNNGQIIASGPPAQACTHIHRHAHVCDHVFLLIKIKGLLKNVSNPAETHTHPFPVAQ